MIQDLKSIEGNLVAIFGEDARNFSNLEHLSQAVFDDIFYHLSDLWYAQKKGEGFGEFDLRSTFSAFRIAFILTSDHWAALITALNLWGISRDEHSNKKGRLSTQEISEVFENTMPDTRFKYMVQCGELRFKNHGGLASAILELAILDPIIYLKQALDCYGLRNFNPVKFINPIELFKQKEFNSSSYYNRINNNFFLEINPYTPIAIIESELDRLKNHIKEKQENLKKEDKKESFRSGTRPEYNDWDHERKSNGVAKEKSLLNNGLFYLEAYGLKRENPDLSLQDLANLWHKEVYGKPVKPEELEAARKTFSRGLKEAEKHVCSALFGNFPPVG